VTSFEQRLHRLQRQRDLALRGYERDKMTPQLSEALRSEIRSALEADGKPFDVNVARRVYDLAIAARDMCVAATSGVKEAIAQIKDTDGPMESLDSSDTPESQMQASETFGARLIREIMAMLPMLQQKKTDDPKALVHALAEARKHGMTDVAEELEIKLFGCVLSGPHPIAPTIDVPEGSYAHGFADGKLGALPCFNTEPYQIGYKKGLEAKYLAPPLDDGPRCQEKNQCEDLDGSGACTGCGRWLGPDEVTTPHEFEVRTTKRFAGPAHETCEHCGKDPRNTIHEVPPVEIEVGGPKFSRPPSGAENASDLPFDDYEAGCKEAAGKLSLDEAERIYKENVGLV